MSGNGPGDDIRKLALKPEVREAIAELADSNPKYGGKQIRDDLTAELKAGKIDSKQIARDVIQSFSAGQVVGRFEGPHTELKTPLEKIVEASGKTSQQAKELVEQYSTAMPYPYTNGFDKAYAQLSNAVQQGIEASVDSVVSDRGTLPKDSGTKPLRGH